MSKQKRWLGRIYTGRDDNGKQTFIWVGRYATKRERDHAVARRKLELENVDPAQIPTVDEYVDRYLTEYQRRHKASSYSTVENQLQRFKKDFKGRSMDISRPEAKEWVYGEGCWTQNGAPPARMVPAVITLFNHAIDDDDLPLTRNPFRGLATRSKGRADKAPPTEAEFDALLQACSVLKEYAPMMRALTRFAAFTLMRPSELFELEWADIDFDAMRIRKARRVYKGVVDEPKTGAKLIALTPPARDAILGLPRTGRLVFTSKQGRRLSTPKLSTYWGLVRARAGVDLDFYTCSKHFGVWFMWTKLRMSNRAIASQAGWSLRTVDQMLKVYGHGEVGALDEVDEAFAQEARVVKLREVKEAG